MRIAVIDRILAGTTLGIALVSFAWFGGWDHHHRIPATEPGPAVDYLRAAIGAPTVNFEKWQPPRAQTRGAGWIYDVFTPPEIGYDEDTREFTVAPPDDGDGPDNPSRSTGPVLLAIEREPFPLQLIGYVGEDGNYLGAFENLDTAEVFLGGAGREVSPANLLITEFSLRRLPVGITDGAIVSPWIATAVVHDRRTGISMTLREGERAYTNELRAILAGEGEEEDSVVELRTGEEFQGSELTYRIDRLQLEPPAALLTAISSTASQSVRMTLTPSEATDFAISDGGRSISADDE